MKLCEKCVPCGEEEDANANQKQNGEDAPLSHHAPPFDGRARDGQPQQNDCPLRQNQPSNDVRPHLHIVHVQHFILGEQ